MTMWNVGKAMFTIHGLVHLAEGKRPSLAIIFQEEVEEEVYIWVYCKVTYKRIIPKDLNYELASDLMEDGYSPNNPSPYYTFLLSHILNTIYYHRDKNRILKIIELSNCHSIFFYRCQIFL